MPGLLDGAASGVAEQAPGAGPGVRHIFIFRSRVIAGDRRADSCTIWVNAEHGLSAGPAERKKDSHSEQIEV